MERLPSDYYEKLKDPRWQKKRLEVFQRDNWACKCCGSEDRPLHVHHLFYFKDKEPWEIHNGFLITLCEDCHKSEKLDDEDIGLKDGIIEDIGLLLNTIWKSISNNGDLVEIARAIAFKDKSYLNELLFVDRDLKTCGGKR